MKSSLQRLVYTE